MFIGYSHTQKGYKCYLPDSRRVMVSRDVKFVESKGYYDEKSWENLRDLSHGPSDRANNLKIILESLGISKPQSSEAPRTSPSTPVAVTNEEAVPIVEPVHPDPEGGGAMSMNQHQKHQKMIQHQFMIKMKLNLISLVEISMMVIKDRKKQW